MSRPNRTHIPTGVEHLEWVLTDDGSRTLWNATLDETYHSGCGAVAETLVVYLRNSGVLARLQQACGSERLTGVLEYGFGTATGFLLTAAAAELLDAPLVFVSLENELLSPGVFAELEISESTERLLQGSLSASGLLPDIKPLEFSHALRLVSEAWMAARHQLPTSSALGWHFVDIGTRVQLRLWIGDAAEFSVKSLGVASARDTTGKFNLNQPFDAIYFDPFAPTTNPTLWTEQVFRRAFEMLAPGGTLTSYCVKSEVRRALAVAGFAVSKLVGPAGGKREVLLATRPP